MGEMKTWQNGEKSQVVKQIIEDNFRTLFSRADKNILTVSTAERLALPTKYLYEGLTVYDRDLNEFYKYDNGWNKVLIGIGSEIEGLSYIKDITVEDWQNGTISILYTEHNISMPMVKVYILKNNLYEEVLGGVQVNDSGDIIILSDISFEGKVVVK